VNNIAWRRKMSEIAESSLKIKKIHKLVTISVRGVRVLLSEFYIYLISLFYNIAWLTRIVKVLMIITLLAIVVYVYKELRGQRLESKYLKFGKKNEGVKRRKHHYLKLKA